MTPPLKKGVGHLEIWLKGDDRRFFLEMGKCQDGGYLYNNEGSSNAVKIFYSNLIHDFNGEGKCFS